MISIVVPVYKVEKYLDRCVQSILAQSYTDFELILVDDGSPDNCPLICDNYAKSDNRVIVLHKSNGGLSEARNEGIKIAKGSLITFIDSDDYINKDYISILYNNLIKYDASCSVIGLEKFFENRAFKEPSMNLKSYVISGREALCQMLYQKDLDTHAWGVLLPTVLAKEFLFPVGKYHEDEFTTYNYYFNSERVAVSRAKGYYYFQRSDSIMHSFNKSAYDELEAADFLVDFCNKHATYAVKAAMSKKFSDYCQVLLSVDKLENENEEMFNRIKDYLLQNRLAIMFDVNTRLKNKIAGFFLVFGVKGLRFINSFRK